MDEEDTRLLVKYRKGDPAALGELVEKYRRPLFGFILNMTGTQTDADEVFQEVWLRVITRFSLYRPSSFAGWVMRIARNIIIDRSRRRKAVVSLDATNEEGSALVEVLPAQGPGPGAEAENRDLNRRLAEAVRSLPREQREVFVLRMQSGLSFKEIAAVQKVSINTALARMQYALAKLRPALAREYGELKGGTA
jgi:RNA polymerase sigma-70 factor, ECF subfamily